MGFITILYKNGVEHKVSTFFIDDFIYIFSDGRKYCSVCSEWVEVLTSKKELINMGIKFNT